MSTMQKCREIQKKFQYTRKEIIADSRFFYDKVLVDTGICTLTDEEILNMAWEKFDGANVNSVCLICHSGSVLTWKGMVCPVCTFGKPKKLPCTPEEWEATKKRFGLGAYRKKVRK